MSKFFNPPLPHEHGAWAMFLIPLVIGTGVGLSRTTPNNSANIGILLLCFWLTALGFFLARYPLGLLVKARDPNARGNAMLWSAIYSLVTLVGGVTLVVLTQLGWLVLLGLVGGIFLVVYLWLVMRRKEMSVVGEWTGIAGAALAAPGAYLVLAHTVDITALMLYLLNVWFFGGTVYYIKFKVREQLKIVKPDATVSARLQAARMPMLYSAIILLFVAALIWFGWVPWLTLLAFLLSMVKVIFGALDRPVRLNVPRLGIIEVIYSIAFAVVIISAFR